MFKTPESTLLTKGPQYFSMAADDHRESPIPGEHPIPGDPPMPGEQPTPADPPVVPPSPVAQS